MKEHLRSLTEMLRHFWDNILDSEFIERGSEYVDLETELVRAEDYLLKLEEERKDANI